MTPLTFERAQELAVVATAQLFTVAPGIRADVAIREVGSSLDGWTVEVSWSDGVSPHTMRQILDDQPEGLVLLQRTRAN